MLAFIFSRSAPQTKQPQFFWLLSFYSNIEILRLTVQKLKIHDETELYYMHKAQNRLQLQYLDCLLLLHLDAEGVFNMTIFNFKYLHQCFRSSIPCLIFYIDMIFNFNVLYNITKSHIKFFFIMDIITLHTKDVVALRWLDLNEDWLRVCPT